MKLRPLSCLLLATCAFACPKETSDAQANPERRDAATLRTTSADTAHSPTQKPSLVSAGRALMGTWFELKIEQLEQEDEARAALKRALDEIARLEDVLSEWRPHTELSAINAEAGGKAVAVGPETYQVLRTGLAVSKLSGGAFDMTWAALRGLYRFERGAPPELPDPALVKKQRALVDYRDLVLDDTHHTARLKRKGMAVGTGGIAKGFALDRAAALIEQAGFTNYLLFAGGQVQVHGAREGRAWRVGIQHPRKEGHVGFFEVHSGSISTSGDYEHAYEWQGKRIHHIIDPKTGAPATRSASVTLIARQGIEADALSTACFVLGPTRCLAMLKKHGQGVEAVIIDPELRVTVSGGMVGKVQFQPPLQDGRLPD